MGQRLNVLWGITIAMLVVAIIYIGYSNYGMSKQVESLRQQRIVLGTDQQLEETVTTLEKSLVDRLAYTTKVSVDPLDLTRTITSKKFLNSLGLRETLEQRGRMRLSCTVVGESSSAIVKFMGRSYVVHEGDIFNGFKVDQITKARMFLSKGGAKLVLINESASADELSEGNKATSVTGKNY